MRTPNTECCLCKKPLYRRPNELAKVRYSACLKCRTSAQKLVTLTDKQVAALQLGRAKGTNHRAGYKHKEESRRKLSASHKKFCAENPDKIARRGEKIRGENHYLWKNDSTKLNTAIRRLTEYRKWAAAVKDRDKGCVRCKSIDNLESHHLVTVAEMVSKLQIQDTQQARSCEKLWEVTNGVTLCGQCHATEHGRQYIPPTKGRRYNPKPKYERKSTAGSANPNWRGGKIEKRCQRCTAPFNVKICERDKRKFCSRKCVNENQRKNVSINAARIAGVLSEAT